MARLCSNSNNFPYLQFAAVISYPFIPEDVLLNLKFFGKKATRQMYRGWMSAKEWLFLSSLVMNEQSNLKSHPQVGLLGLYYDPYINTIWLGSRVHWYTRRHSKVLSLTFRASKFVSIKKYIFELYLCYTSNAMKYLRRYLPGTKKYPTVHFVDFTIL